MLSATQKTDEPEEVAVDSSLHDSRHPNDPVSVVRLGEESVDPVEQVHDAVSAEREDVVGGQRLDETASRASNGVNHHQLRNDRNGLQVDRKRPQDLKA